jgi:hypothetical protein
MLSTCSAGRWRERCASSWADRRVGPSSEHRPAAVTRVALPSLRRRDGAAFAA